MSPAATEALEHWVKRHAWLVFAMIAASITAVTFGVAVWRWVDDAPDQAAQWAMACGGFALVSFAGLELHLDRRKSEERRKAALVRVKPIALLARRQCEAGVRESDGAYLHQWLATWYGGEQGKRPIDILERRVAEVVDRVAEAGPDEVKAADWAFGAFVSAADKMNPLNRELSGPVEHSKLRELNPRGQQIIYWLRTAALELEKLARRTADEPDLPLRTRFALEEGADVAKT